MIIGRQDVFAVEVVVGADAECPAYPVVQGNNITGRGCLWLGGVRVGRIEVPSVWLRQILNELLIVKANHEDLWDAALGGKSNEEVFDFLDRWCFYAHRGRSLIRSAREHARLQASRPPGNWMRFSFVTNWCESFDGVKGFVMCPGGGNDLRVLIAWDGRRIAAFGVPISELLDVVQSFQTWLEAKEREFGVKPLG